MPAISLHWLGSPMVKVDGEETLPKTRKALALIIYLSVTRRGHSRDSLSTLLWPDFDRRRAHANLRQTLLYVNKIFGKEFCELHRDVVSIGAAPGIWVDTDELMKTLGKVEAHRHGKGGMCDDCMRSMQDLAGICRGHFLDGFHLPGCSEYDIWQESQGQEYSQKLSNVFERLVNASIIAKDRQNAIYYARRWLLEDSCNELAHRTLMRLYFEIGKKYASLRQYQDCIKSLKEELGISPEPKTLELYSQICKDNLDDEQEISHHQSVIQARADSQASGRALPIKNSIPFMPNDYVERSRLDSKLNDGLQIPVTLVSGPAGFGKTTLLAQWAQCLMKRQRVTVAWFSVDGSDNDEVRFLNNLSHSLSSARSMSLEKEYLFLQTAPAPMAKATIDSFLYALEAKSEPVAIVLDDFHFIENKKVHALLMELIERMPSNVHVFISTRSDSPVGISRFRLNKGIIEIRMDDLRFTAQEMEAYLNTCRRLDLSDRELDLLVVKTEGWIAGLQIAANSLKGDRGDSAAIANFCGSKSQIMDYMVEEVLHGQDMGVMDFLLRTAILDKMTDSLCRAMTGMDSCQEILERLVSLNLFIQQLDEDRLWYRYHHLFRDVLETRLRRSLTDEKIRSMHMTAARWYLSQGLYDDAITHSLHARNYGFIARLIDAAFMEKLSQGDHGAVVAWIDAMPDDVVRKYPNLCVAKSWALLFSGLIAQAEVYLKCVQDSVRDASGQEESRIPSYITAIRAYVAECRGDEKLGMALALEANEQLAEDDFFPRGVMFFLLGRLYRKMGDLDSAEGTFLKIAELGISHGNQWMQAISVCDIATIRQMQGRLSEASEICRNFILRTMTNSESDHGTAARVLFRFSDILYEKNKIKEARKNIATGFNSMLEGQNPNDLAFGNIELAQIYLAARNERGAKHTLKTLDELKTKFDLHPHLVSWMEICRIRFERESGNWYEAAALARRLVSKKVDGPLVKEFELIEYCRVLVHCPDDATNRQFIREAMGIMDDLSKTTKLEGRLYRHYQLVILQAVATNLMGNSEEALILITRALASLESEGYLRTFLDEGALVADLLKMGQERRTWASVPLRYYVDSIQSAFARESLTV